MASQFTSGNFGAGFKADVGDQAANQSAMGSDASRVSNASSSRSSFDATSKGKHCADDVNLRQN